MNYCTLAHFCNSQFCSCLSRCVFCIRSSGRLNIPKHSIIKIANEVRECGRECGRATFSGPFYCLLYFDLTCLPYLSWIQLQPVTVLPPAVGMDDNNYIVQRLSSPMDFYMIQPRRWQNPLLTYNLFLCVRYIDKILQM